MSSDRAKAGLNTQCLVGLRPVGDVHWKSPNGFFLRDLCKIQQVW
jgi:hypothetical protein